MITILCINGHFQRSPDPKYAHIAPEFMHTYESDGLAQCKCGCKLEGYTIPSLDAQDSVNWIWEKENFVELDAQEEHALKIEYATTV